MTTHNPDGSVMLWLSKKSLLHIRPCSNWGHVHWRLTSGDGWTQWYFAEEHEEAIAMGYVYLAMES